MSNAWVAEEVNCAVCSVQLTLPLNCLLDSAGKGDGESRATRQLSVQSKKPSNNFRKPHLLQITGLTKPHQNSFQHDLRFSFRQSFLATHSARHCDKWKAAAWMTCGTTQELGRPRHFSNNQLSHHEYYSEDLKPKMFLAGPATY